MEVIFMQGHYNVLFLCTSNSARSIIAEAIMNLKGRPKFTAYSAGSHPSGMLRPEALRQLRTAHIPTTGLRSKAWDEFSLPDSPELHFVFTVCDNAAKEVCPIWPGQPMTAHWGIPDPAAVQGTTEQVERAFRDAFLHARPAHHPVSQPSAGQSRPARTQAGNREDRPAMKFSLHARAIAEFVGTAFLLAAVVGSGIMGEQLAG